MIHLCGWHANVAWTANQRQSLPALKDTALFTSGMDLRVPANMGTVIATGTRTGATAIAGVVSSLESPYLLRRAPHYISPISDAGSWSYLGGLLRAMPSMTLVPQESVRAWWQSPTAQSSAKLVTTLMWLADAVPQPVTSGELMTVRGVTSAATSAGVWDAATLTWDRELPYGDYRVIGMRVFGPSVIAVRLVLPGTPWRPGVPAMIEDELGPAFFSGGMMGELARFNSNQPPSVELLAASAVAARVYLDLVPM